MISDVFEFEQSLAAAPTLDDKLDCATDALCAFGFSGLAYDLTPVAFSPEGEVITPSLVKLRNLPADMLSHWCDDGYYQIDPVQRLALKSSCPFFWPYRADAQTPINSMLSATHAPVVEYLHDARIPCGMTVPIHLPGGGCAVVTGFWPDSETGDAARTSETMANFTLLANILNTVLLPQLDDDALRTRGVHLTPRERECIALSANGLSAKQIAYRLDRSEPTVVLHLQSAARKLGARNRAQAIARAAHYRLLN